MTNELDRMVAERVMGWIKGELSPAGYSIEVWSDPSSLGYIFTYDEWHPSTDIAQVFQVVERMRELGYQFELNDYSMDWTAMFIHPQIIEKDGKCTDGDKEFAICRAALAAIKSNSPAPGT